MKYDKNRPVSSIQHDDKRAAIPDLAHQGEEQKAIEGKDSWSKYQIFRHEFVRGRDPELYWLDKYKNDDADDPGYMPALRTDIRSLYKHEDIRPEAIIDNLYDLHEHKDESAKMQLDLFGDLEDAEDDEIERLAGYYKHSDNWLNRLIQGDSLLVMNSLLNREGMKGQVQCIYIDPPYGIKYGGNWQMRINNTNVKENDDGISGEPEMIKAYRDTWELGIHSYLSYLRDRLVMARELLTESGSCFVQISDENIHLVRSVMDEVFGSENFISMITTKKSGGLASNTISNISDYILWYAKDIDQVKIRKLYIPKSLTEGVGLRYNRIEEEDGTIRAIKLEEQLNPQLLPKGARIFLGGPITSQDSASEEQPFVYEGKTYYPPRNRHWSATYPDGMNRLVKLNRIIKTKDFLNYKIYFDDFPVVNLSNLWADTMGTAEQNKQYVVQTSTKPIQRCILMASDPGDLVLDPTCGSGTTAFVAEQWGRRWITIDTSRIALNIAKKRLTTALFPYYKTYDDSENPNIRRGFVYKKVPHVTMRALANDLPFDEETLYDQPEEDKKRIRVSGPFTVETLQSLDVSSPESLNDKQTDYNEYAAFTDRIFSNLKANGIRNGIKEQQAKFITMEHVDNEDFINAKGYYAQEDGTQHCVYFMIGPKYGTVSKHAVNEAIRSFRQKHLNESSWLAILGFSFEDSILTGEQDYNFGTFQVTKVRMSDDLLQDGLMKKDKNAGTFIIIGEPDVSLVKDNEDFYHVEINGMDMYDPIQDQVKARNIHDIAYWEMDDNYKGSLFKVRSIHFCGGDKNEFKAWKKGLETIAKDKAKKKAERTLRLEFNDEVWDTLYDFKSEPIKYEKGKKIAVRVVSQFGEESTKILEMQ